MGKKKKKKKKYSQGYDQKEMNKQADVLETYINQFDTYIIREGTDEDEYQKALKTIRYQKALKTIRKAIENLRNGNGDAVYDQERFNEMEERKRCNFDDEDL